LVGLRARDSAGGEEITDTDVGTIDGLAGKWLT
jgi:hypothetical protein